MLRDDLDEINGFDHAPTDADGGGPCDDPEAEWERRDEERRIDESIRRQEADDGRLERAVDDLIRRQKPEGE